MRENKVKYHTGPHGDGLWIYKNGYMEESISIFSSYDAVNWASRHGMTYRETVTADNDKNYDIYWKPGRLIAAIPRN